MSEPHGPSPAVPDGVPVWAWAKVARPHGARWAIPERDAGGEVIGTAYRDAKGGKDFAPGGRRGLIVAWPLDAYAGSSASEPVFVCEGASDTAALIGLRLDAVGVPMTGHCGAKVAELLAERHAVIVADADHAGRGGAAKVADALAARCASVRIIEPPNGAKDARAAVIAGADGEAFLELAKSAPPIERQTAAGGAPSLLAYKPFPTGVLPEPVRSFVIEGAAAIGCDESFVALPLLAGLASAIGNTRRIELKRGWTEPAIVWTAIVAESGSKKSPPIELALGPIRRRQHDAMKEHADAMRDHTDALAIHERDAAHWKKSKSHADPPAKPEAPVASRYWTDDATTEALAVLLQQNPRGLLVARDELAGWFAFDAYKSGKGADAAKWLEMHGGRPLVVDRKSGGMLYVPNASVSITGSIQPETLRRVLGQEHRDNGMAARLLFAEPPRRVARWTEAEVDPNTEAALVRLFDRLYDLKPDADSDGNLRPRLLGLTPDGKAEWVTFHDEHAAEQAELSGDEAAAWSKLEGYAARLALVIHLARWAGDDPTRVEGVSIAAGVALSRWFGHEAKRVYSRLGESDDGRERRRLVERISGNGGAVTVRELARGPQPYRDNAGRARAALAELVAAGVGVWEWDAPGARGGRPPERFRLL